MIPDFRSLGLLLALLVLAGCATTRQSVDLPVLSPREASRLGVQGAYRGQGGRRRIQWKIQLDPAG
jgi:hypothetical protein